MGWGGEDAERQGCRLGLRSPLTSFCHGSQASLSVSAEGRWARLCLERWRATVDHPVGCVLPKGTEVHPLQRLPQVWRCTHSKTRACTSSVSHTSALCLQNRSFCHVTFMFGPPTAMGRLNGISPCLFTANHVMLPTTVFSIPSHVSAFSFASYCIVLLLPWFPCALPCQSFSFALYRFWSLSAFITSLHSDFETDFYWTLLSSPVTAPQRTHFYRLTNFSDLLL